MKQIFPWIMFPIVLVAFMFNLLGLMNLFPRYITLPAFFITLYLFFYSLFYRKVFRGYRSSPRMKKG
ncbi:hypothetical protein EDD68_10952 [Melghiribacillus thermohalophilus]|uniref:Uncharacterized protein n=1 Tax=Melghiribacillus thermohalophilus TaxID=1324956 RepID=A0A4R3N350_9BACI|nr:hypothetical protein [Melghiribacillus thermohalophilus]TCT22406.1 hypothetical protein EDD68_10952 [Melghiribacillus thermohalophilus]